MKKKHLLIDVWNDYADVLNNKHQILSSPSIENIIGEMFALGEFYYYVINIGNSTLSNHHPNILKMHGIKNYPDNLDEIIDLIHPDDLDFVMNAERMCLEKMKEIDGFKYQQQLKSSYCFRMRTAKGNYEMFHHQALHTQKDENGKLLQAVNIHTNIQHITSENPYTVLLSGIGGRTDFHQMHYKKNFTDQPKESLSKRELEILNYITKGYSASEIAKLLHISFYTVRTHRKNILRKTNSKNTSDLMRNCFQWGLI